MTTGDLTFERIRDSMHNVMQFDAGQITETATFRDLDMDSMDRMELAIVIEEEFNVDIPDAAVIKWTGVADVVNTVKEITNG